MVGTTHGRVNEMYHIQLTFFTLTMVLNEDTSKLKETLRNTDFSVEIS